VGVIYDYLQKKVPAKKLGTPVLVNIQNITDYIVEASPYFIKDSDMNVSPPWEYAIFEWDVAVPASIREKKRGEFFNHNCMLFDAQLCDEGGWDFQASLYFASDKEDKVYDYFSYDGRITKEGKVTALHAENGVNFLRNEALVNVVTGEEIDLAFHYGEEKWKEDMSAIRYSYLRMVFTALTFANCHNVVIRDTVPHLTRQQRRHGGPAIVYKTIDIPGISVRYKPHVTMSSPEYKRRLHLCRGHFAHHENLFGRLGPRTIWVPTHVKGSAEAGIVVKEYSISP
jgi:hypothetical protein